jgi:hypothetical protein
MMVSYISVIIGHSGHYPLSCILVYKHNISETIYRPRNVVLKRKRTMDNVQNVNNCIIVILLAINMKSTIVVQHMLKQNYTIFVRLKCKSFLSPYNTIST